MASRALSGSGSGSGSVVGAVGDASAASSAASDLGGTIRIGAADGSLCSYYAATDGSSCRQPRSCYDCLNTPVPDVADGCVLSPSGFCEEATSYAHLSDFRRNLTDAELHSSGWYNYYPASNATYCEPADAACARCNALLANGSASVYSMGWGESVNAPVEVLRQFCLGADGCVCVLACESADWRDSMMADCDSTASGAGADASADTPNYSTLLPLFFLLQLLLLGAFVYRRMLLSRLLRAGPRPQPVGPYNNVRAISSPSNHLRLSGWRKMQTDLIERERKQGLFTLRSPHQDVPAIATATAASTDYEASGSPAATSTVSALTPVVTDAAAVEDDRNSIAVLEAREGSSDSLSPGSGGHRSSGGENAPPRSPRSVV